MSCFCLPAQVGIIVLTAQSATLSEVVTKTLVGRSASLASAASVIGSSLVPAAVSVINTFMPPLIQVGQGTMIMRCPLKVSNRGCGHLILLDTGMFPDKG